MNASLCQLQAHFPFAHQYGFHHCEIDIPPRHSGTSDRIGTMYETDTSNDRRAPGTLVECNHATRFIDYYTVLSFLSSPHQSTANYMPIRTVYVTPALDLMPTATDQPSQTNATTSAAQRAILAYQTAAAQPSTWNAALANATIPPRKSAVPRWAGPATSDRRAAQLDAALQVQCAPPMESAPKRYARRPSSIGPRCTRLAPGL
jgi:hypothetical protein